MRSLLILFFGIGSLVYIDLNLLLTKRYSSGSITNSSLDINSQKETRRRKQRRYRNRKYKKKAYFKPKHFKLKGTNAKDRRYSNQKDIRRMHTSYA